MSNRTAGASCASEVDRAQGTPAAAMLVKAPTSNDELRQTLQRVLSQPR